MEQVRFFPNDAAYKQPMGAIEAGEPLRLNIKFNRPSNPSEVFLVLTKDGESDVYYPMQFVTVDPDTMMEYTAEVTVTTRGLYFYHFIVNTEDKQYRIGCGDDMHALLGKGHDWQLTVYEKTYKTPSFLRGGLIYQIMPDRFYDGGARRKTKSYATYRDDWYGLPEWKPDADGKIRNDDFFGGNLRGIIKKLGYLKGLGVTCIYLNPIFEAHSNHPY
ncbi:MAG: glycoside hydrolase family 13 protein, partial [Clostridiales bacterium]|nr:glycoside hydrolase family 13 protein [Clostridiales bacterium]